MRFIGGQTFSLRSCLKVRNDWLAAIAEAKPRAAILLEGWSGEGSKKVAENWIHPCEKTFDDAFAHDLSDLIQHFEAAGTRTILALMPPPIVRDLSPSYAHQWGALGDDELTALFEQRMACLNRVRLEVAQRTGSPLLDLESLVCPDGNCLSELNGLEIRPDGMHFSGASAAWVSRWMLVELEQFEPREAP